MWEKPQVKCKRTLRLLNGHAQLLRVQHDSHSQSKSSILKAVFALPRSLACLLFIAPLRCMQHSCDNFTMASQWSRETLLYSTLLLLKESQITNSLNC